jgi:hypothetical protein
MSRSLIRARMGLGDRHITAAHSTFLFLNRAFAASMSLDAFKSVIEQPYTKPWSSRHFRLRRLVLFAN